MSAEGAMPREQTSAMFSIAEILESILISVDMKTILLSQRVNKFWHNVIGNSTKLQKKLFFLPATLEEAIDLMAADNKVINLTRDAQLFSGVTTWNLLEEEQAVIKTGDEPSQSGPNNVMVLNPLLFALLFGKDIDTITYTGRKNTSQKVRRFCNFRRLITKSHQVSGSWQRMQIAHPFSDRVILHANLNGVDQQDVEGFGEIAISAYKGTTRSIESGVDYRYGEDGFPLTIGETFQRVEEALSSKYGYTFERISSYFEIGTHPVAVCEDEGAVTKVV